MTQRAVEPAELAAKMRPVHIASACPDLESIKDPMVQRAGWLPVRISQNMDSSTHQNPQDLDPYPI